MVVKWNPRQAGHCTAASSKLDTDASYTRANLMVGWFQVERERTLSNSGTRTI